MSDVRESTTIALHQADNRLIIVARLGAKFDSEGVIEVRDSNLIQELVQ